ncbi:MAG: hypothetical protein EXS37_14390 [Opitutus sp.]|nr:hypothetical protein [Opitutus sp.]
MKKIDPVITFQLALIKGVTDDEKWLESERQGHDVGVHDPVVQDKVAGVVLCFGEDWRKMGIAQLAAERQARLGPIVPPPAVAR